jgi:hypothetical protein
MAINPAVNKIGNHDGTFDKGAQRDVLAHTNDVATALVGSADVLTAPGLFVVNTAGVDAMTLGQPTAGDQQAGGDDGKKLTVVDNGGHAHTITCATNGLINSHHLVTFNGTIGSFVTLRAYNGIWYPLELSGVTVS